MKHVLLAFLLCSSVAFAQSPAYFKEQVTCLADNVYFEARGEGKKGWEAVASVTMNRYRHDSFPKSVCGVVYQKRRSVCQFSWVCNNPKMNHRNSELYKDIYDTALHTYIGDMKDPTHGALFYHTADISKSKLGLIKKTHRTKQIGNHIFYR